jgi:hypothetical protein
MASQSQGASTEITLLVVLLVLIALAVSSYLF